MPRRSLSVLILHYCCYLIRRPIQILDPSCTLDIRLSGAVAVVVVLVDGVVGLFVWSTRYRCIGRFAILRDVGAGCVSSLCGFWDDIV